MNKTIKWLLAIIVLIAAVFGAYQLITRMPLGSSVSPGTQIDDLNGVAIYYNGGVNQSHGRNLSTGGYNLGIRYQCIEFVKRYYYERFGHQMPDSYGHAKTFFDQTLPDGALNEQRALLQYHNGGTTMPAPDDIIVYGPSLFNPYGHVAIVAQVNPYAVVVAQQNAGPVYSSREAIPLTQQDSGYRLGNSRVLGWLRLPPQLNRALKLNATTGSFKPDANFVYRDMVGGPYFDEWYLEGDLVGRTKLKLQREGKSGTLEMPVAIACESRTLTVTGDGQVFGHMAISAAEAQNYLTADISAAVMDNACAND